MLISAFGRRILLPTTLELPGWPPTSGDADVHVEFAAVSDDPGERLATKTANGESILWIDRLENGDVRIDAPVAARFQIAHDGSHVRCEKIDPLFDALLVGQVFPMLAAMHGIEVFHTAAVAIDGKAWLFAANSGVGKTTLAAYLIASGATLLADDVVAITADDSGLTVLGTSGPLRLHEPTASEVLASADPERIVVASTDSDKVLLRAATTIEDAVPLGGFVMLSRTAGAEPGVEEVQLGAAELLGATFNFSIRTPERLLRQLDLCHRIAAEVPAYRVEAGSAPPAALASMVRDQAVGG